MPSGKKIDDGFPTTIAFANAPNISFWEKEITPPGFSGGGANDTTTMRNTAWRTKAPKKLLSLTDVTGTAAYDPKIYNDIVAQGNKNQQMTTLFADGSKLQYYGWLDEFKPNPVKEGEQPTAAFTIIPSNQDGTGAEVAPVYTAPP